LAAFRAFGSACVEHLEGDFAFLIWDRHARRVFCARDFTGRRPLFLAEWRGGLVVATSLDSIATLQGFHPQVDMMAVGADAAGLLFALDDETCMLGVRSLRSGNTARWSARDRLVTQRFWHPTPSVNGPLPFDEAAERLRELLESAVMERMSPGNPTAIWMSGGRDSTAIFASGMNSIRREGRGSELLPVCRSHPVGDSGREDEMIDEIARFWRVTPHWLDSRDTPMFPGMLHRTRWSSEPFAQPFEALTRALAIAARTLGATVALDGYGGDFLFQVSRIYLADLVSRGMIARALGDWRAMDHGREGARGFFHYGMRPLLPRFMERAIALARRGRPLRRPMERIAPPWIKARFVREHNLEERFVALGPSSQPGPSATERESQFYLTHQFFARVNSKMAGFASDHGVALRSPLLDSHVVSFALSRPQEERNRAGDQKRLLRAAMKGLLPDSVLAPRQAKTGTLRSYFAENMQLDGFELLTQMMPAPALASAGVVDVAELQRAVVRYRAEGLAYPHAESLFCTMQAEAWLLARAKSGATSQLQRKVGAQ
jgi:asparagine synthase (glutamine-hydrolysing)